MDNVTGTLGPASGNYRVRAWLANRLAAGGQTQRALATIETVVGSEPKNGYLLYRVAHALVELGKTAEAIEALEAAVHAGFLSREMMRNEEACGLNKLINDGRYLRIVEVLERRTDVLRRKYGLPM